MDLVDLTDEECFSSSANALAFCQVDNVPVGFAGECHKRLASEEILIAFMLSKSSVST